MDKETCINNIFNQLNNIEEVEILIYLNELIKNILKEKADHWACFYLFA